MEPQKIQFTNWTKKLEEQSQQLLTPEKIEEARELLNELNLNYENSDLKTWKFSHIRTLIYNSRKNEHCKNCLENMKIHKNIDFITCSYEQTRTTLKLEGDELTENNFKCNEFFKYRALGILKKCNIPKIFQELDAKRDFKITSGNSDALKLANSAVLNNTGVYFYGEPGAGKTMLSSIIAIERALRNKYTKFYTVTELIFYLNPYNYHPDLKYEVAKYRDEVRKCDCLIIDDFGVEKPSDWTYQTLFDIFDYRYKNDLQTIFTSNFSLEQIKTRYTAYEGERIIRRIKAICKPVFMAYK